MDHGDHAKVGDLVELIGPNGQCLGIIKLVLGVQEVSRRMFNSSKWNHLSSEKYLYLEGQAGKRKACFTRIVQRATK